MIKPLAVTSTLLVLLYAVYLSLTGSSPLPTPVKLDVTAHPDQLGSVEFLDLLEHGTPTSTLAEPGYYTVVEGYLDSCGICRVLESRFPAFLENRPDVVIRKVHFPESGVSVRFNSPADLRDYYRRMSLYRFNVVQDHGDSFGLKVCGTPHVEIYAPDGTLLEGDLCETGSKTGLELLNAWIGAES